MKLNADGFPDTENWGNSMVTKSTNTDPANQTVAVALSHCKLVTLAKASNLGFWFIFNDYHFY